MFERFTDRARKVMALANQEATRFNHEYIGTEHILLGLLKEGSGVGATVLKNAGVELRNVRAEVEKLMKAGSDFLSMGKLPQTPRVKRVIEYAIEESRRLGHNYVGTEHMLLGLIREEEGVAAQVLVNLGLSLTGLRTEVNNLLGAGVERGTAMQAALHAASVQNAASQQESVVAIKELRDLMVSCLSRIEQLRETETNLLADREVAIANYEHDRITALGNRVEELRHRLGRLEYFASDLRTLAERLDAIRRDFG